MQRFVTIIMSFTLTTFFAFTTHAGPRARHDKARGAAQHKRIQQGVKSGEITKEERADLHQDQKEMRDDRQEALADDGHINKKEKRKLRKERHEASKDIYEAKHN